MRQELPARQEPRGGKFRLGKPIGLGDLELVLDTATPVRRGRHILKFGYVIQRISRIHKYVAREIIFESMF